MAGIFLQHEGALLPLTEAPYATEALLQELVARHPETLAGGREAGPLLLVRREAAVYDEDDVNAHGSLDHLFLDGEGVPVLVEIKRSTDSRIRREVVGQMLDYAAGAANWKVEQLQTWLDERCATDKLDADQLIGDHTDDDPEAFWENVRVNLGARRMRLVFVADVVPRTLQAIVEFLNEQMTECEVIAIEIKQYLDAEGKQTIIVPTVLGRTEKAKEAKGNRKVRRWDRSSFLRDLADKQSSDVIAAVGAILEWADGRGDLAWRFGHGGTASLQVGVQDDELRIFPFVIYSNGWLELPFVRMASYAPFNDQRLRQQYVDRLAAIDGIDLGSEAVGRRPNLPLSVLLGTSARERFLQAVDWALSQGVRG